jgi:hypothetical protein
MPFFLIPTALGVCFFLIWAFIGGMIFRDSQLAAERERESEVMTLPLAWHVGGPKSRPNRSKVRRVRRETARFAS